MDGAARARDFVPVTPTNNYLPDADLASALACNILHSCDVADWVSYQPPVDVASAEATASIVALVTCANIFSPPFFCCLVQYFFRELLSFMPPHFRQCL